jgi:hypothetical protein
MAPPESEPTTPAEKIEREFTRQMDLYDPPYKKIKSPALSFYAINEKHWAVKPDTDDATKKKAQEFIEKVVRPFQLRNAEKFRKEVKRGQVVILRDSNHYFFLDPNQKDAIVTQVCEFLLKK